MEASGVTGPLLLFPKALGGKGSACPWDSPIDDELVIGGRLVTHRAHPGGLLLIHLEVEYCVEALQVRTGLCAAGHRQPHLHQLWGQRDGCERLPSRCHPPLAAPMTSCVDSPGR